MLTLKRKSKTLGFPGRTRKGRPFEVILATLSVFGDIGRKEISLTEFQESIAEFQRIFATLGYDYSSRFCYSLDLLSDLEDLVYHGYVHQYQYKYDGFLPNRYLALTTLGKGRGNKIVKLISEDTLEKLKRSVNKAEQDYKSKWRLWAR